MSCDCHLHLRRAANVVPFAWDLLLNCAIACFLTIYINNFQYSLLHIFNLRYMSLHNLNSTFISLRPCFCCVSDDYAICPCLASNFESNSMGLELMQDITPGSLLVKNQWFCLSEFLSLYPKTGVVRFTCNISGIKMNSHMLSRLLSIQKELLIFT